ncbi:MAG: trehalose-phosphatase [bacterium]|nr:trehalose-phosphatase [bacterium]
MLKRKSQEYLQKYPKVCLFLDYDGTLTKIRKLPELAVLDKNMREILTKLKNNKKYYLGIISGRELQDVKGLVKLNGLYYSGNHGLEIRGKGINFTHEATEKTVFLLDELASKLSENLKDTQAFIEHKGFSLSLHYRNALDEKLVSEIFHQTFDAFETTSLQLFQGKKVFEIRPKVNWHKGKAIAKLFNILDLHSNLGIIFIGDDRTDEDGFKFVNSLNGLSIHVGKGKNTAARYCLKDTNAVKDFLAFLAKWSYS